MNSTGSSTQALSGRHLICPKCGVTLGTQGFQILKDKLLIVEGKDDEEFFDALTVHLGLKDIQVAGIGGKTQMRSRLKALAKEFVSHPIGSLGVIRDADADPMAAFSSVRDALAKAGLPCPKKPLSPAKGALRVNVMILPSSDKEGALEDLCLEAVKRAPATTCVDEFFTCLYERDAKPRRDLIKAKVKAFLASQEDPTLSLGLAARKGYWPFDHQSFEPLRRFLKAL